jgi:hypothetical protein
MCIFTQQLVVEGKFPFSFSSLFVEEKKEGKKKLKTDGEKLEI